MKVTDIYLILCLCCGVLVGVTATEWLNSLSAHDGTPNQYVYRLMHGFAIMWLASSKEIKSNKWIAVGMLGILSLDMHDHYVLHSIFTVSTMLFAIISLILFAKTKFNKILMWSWGISALVIFAVGYYISSFWFLIAELIVIAIVLGLKRYEFNSLKLNNV